MVVGVGRSRMLRRGISCHITIYHPHIVTIIIFIIIIIIIIILHHSRLVSAPTYYTTPSTAPAWTNPLSCERMSLDALSILSPYHLIVTWPAVFLCGLVLAHAWGRGGGGGQEQQGMAFDDQRCLLYMESERRRLCAEKRAAAESARTVVGGRVRKRRRGRTGRFKLRLGRGESETEERGKVQNETQGQVDDGDDKNDNEVVVAEMELEELSSASDVSDKGMRTLDKVQPTIDQGQIKDQIERTEKFVSLAFSFQSRHSSLGSPPRSPTQTSIHALPVPPPIVTARAVSPTPRTLGPIVDIYSPSSPLTIAPPTLSPFTPQPTLPTQYTPLAKSPPPPGSYVLRRRPLSSILPNSIDTTDLYDGPFLVIASSTPQKRFITISLPAGSLAPPRIAVDDAVITSAPARKGGKRGEGGLYAIDRIRGEKIVWAKSGVGWKRKLLVHWEGWGCEDDTWEPEEGLPVEVVDAFDARVLQWRISLEGY
ncbi:hypothetical protein DFP73DRAFT_321469 [Morchella snyderi]|nr:hypothetical protein DFP73DRAFT_321469 [Morchella snyderi]